jgi:CHAT domain-containing protein
LATLSNVQGAIGDAGVVHFATHAIVDQNSPGRSFLALSEGGKLTVDDVAGLKLRAGLVVISACRGASGPRSPDGLLGFPRAFLLAGAARVIAPLWDVPDEPTAVLMAEFYKSYLSGVRPVDALRSAQLKLLRELRAGRVIANTPAGPMTLPAHPGLWAGFVLQGAE